MVEVSSLLDVMGAHAGPLSELGYKVRFDLTDLDTGILLDATGGSATVSESREPADAVLKLSSDTLEKLVTGRMSPMLAFSTGRLKVEGSQGVALKLAGLLGE